MKFRLVFIFSLFFTILFCFCSCNADHPLKNDFYGTWDGDYPYDDEFDESKIQWQYTIFESRILFNEIRTSIYIADPKITRESYEILGWRKSNNKDKDQNNDYPNGYIIKIKDDGDKFLLNFYISIDKSKIYSPKFKTGNPLQDIIFNKQ